MPSAVLHVVQAALTKVAESLLPPQLSAQQLAVLGAVYAGLKQQGRWPTFSQVDKALDRAGLNIRSLPLGRRPPDDSRSDERPSRTCAPRPTLAQQAARFARTASSPSSPSPIRM